MTIMTSLFENVVGDVLRIQDFHSSIPFTTPSDALFSSMFVKFQSTPMELFDAMLALFRHADFHSNAVTIQKSEDILDRISIQRQQIAKDRNSRRVTIQIAASSPTSCHPQATNLIPALLAEYIDSQRRPFGMIERASYHYNGEIADDELENMALVHRSWTDVAQRYLRRRIHISSGASLRPVMQSTIIGPWVRELSSLCNLAYTNPKLATNETPRLLAGVLQKCPNLTHLNIRGYQTGLSVGQDVIGLLAGLRYLEHLSLGISLSMNYLELWKVATILHNLRFLKSLSLRHWDIDL